MTRSAWASSIIGFLSGKKFVNAAKVNVQSYQGQFEELREELRVGSLIL